MENHSKRQLSLLKNRETLSFYKTDWCLITPFRKTIVFTTSTILHPQLSEN